MLTAKTIRKVMRMESQLTRPRSRLRSGPSDYLDDVTNGNACEFPVLVSDRKETLSSDGFYLLRYNALDGEKKNIFIDGKALKLLYRKDTENFYAQRNSVGTYLVIKNSPDEEMPRELQICSHNNG